MVEQKVAALARLVQTVNWTARERAHARKFRMRENKMRRPDEKVRDAC